MSDANGQRLSVLCVSSDLDTYRLLKQNAEEDSENPSQFDRAASLQDAIQKLQGNFDYQIILVDSDFNGKFALELIKKIHAFQMKIPLVFMLSSQNESLRAHALASGASGIITKQQQHFKEVASCLREIHKKFYDESSSLSPASEDEDLRTKKRHPRVSPREGLATEEEASIKDALTGVYNHSHLFERIVHEFARAKRHTYPLACLVLDLDHFKSINEKYNYRVGDALLKECVQLLFTHCRISDFIARYGGEEFALVMPQTDYQNAVEVAERLKKVFSDHLFLAAKEKIHLTVSMGVCAYPEDTIMQKSELLTFAVQALYRSKASGRNKITCYRDVLPVFGKNDLPVIRISDEKVLEFQRQISEIASVARKTYLDAAKALIMVMESKDSFTAGHAATCAKDAAETAEALGLDKDDVEMIEHAALLHDIGKICIPDNILLKNGKLTFAEFETIRQHAYLGYKILKPLKFLDRESLLVLHHHEWYNGEGYPCRLKGTAIPLGARIISVVDSYDTMRGAGGRYKKTNTVEHAAGELVSCAGTQFDPRVVKTYLELLVLRGELTVDRYDRERIEKVAAAAEVERDSNPRIL